MFAFFVVFCSECSRIQKSLFLLILLFEMLKATYRQRKKVIKSLSMPLKLFLVSVFREDHSMGREKNCSPRGLKTLRH